MHPPKRREVRRQVDPLHPAVDDIADCIHHHAMAVAPGPPALALEPGRHWQQRPDDLPLRPAHVGAVARGPVRPVRSVSAPVRETIARRHAGVGRHRHGQARLRQQGLLDARVASNPELPRGPCLHAPTPPRSPDPEPSSTDHTHRPVCGSFLRPDLVRPHATTPHLPGISRHAPNPTPRRTDGAGVWSMACRKISAQATVSPQPVRAGRCCCPCGRRRPHDGGCSADCLWGADRVIGPGTVVNCGLHRTGGGRCRVPWPGSAAPAR